LSFFIYTFANKSKIFVYCFEELTASDLFDKTRFWGVYLFYF